MASSEQGTGQHKHKSSEEPFPHHESPTTKGEGKSSGGHEQSARGSESGSSHRNESKGSESGSSHRSESKGSESGSSHRGSGSSGGDSSDLKSREYKGPDGEIHHHTKTYEEQHKGDRK